MNRAPTILAAQEYLRAKHLMEYTEEEARRERKDIRDGNAFFFIVGLVAGALLTAIAGGLL